MAIFIIKEVLPVPDQNQEKVSFINSVYKM